MDSKAVAIDFNKICRLCMSEEPTMTSIFKDDTGSVPLPLRIMACVSVEVTAADPLPGQICNTCQCQVDNWYKFRDLCESSDRTLRRLANNDSVNRDAIIKIQTSARELKRRLCRQRSSTEKEQDAASEAVPVKRLKGKSGEVIQDEWEGERARNEKSNDTQLGQDELAESEDKSELLQVLTMQFNTQVKPEVTTDETDSGGENHQSPNDYSSDDSLNLLAHKEKLLKERQGRRKCRTKQERESCESRRVARTMQTQTGDEGGDSAMEISVEETNGDVNKKRRSKRTQTLVAKKRFRVRPAVPSACTLCDKVYKNAEILRQHMRSHHVSGNIECQHCQIKFSSLRSLKYHEQRNHGNLEPVPCSYCGKKFLDKKYLRIHENIHSQTNQYVCQFCGRKFIMKTNLTVHISRHHTQKTNDFICQVCGKAFPFKLYLKKHFKIHTDYKPHSCSHCDARFRESTLLRKHINSIHLKLRPFVCQYCQKTFTRSLYLRDHMETQHLGIPKKAECLRCGETFHNRSRQRQHDCESRLEVL